MSRRLPAEKMAAAKALRAKGHSIREVCALSGIAGIGTVHRDTKGIRLPFGPLKRGPKRKIPFNVCKALQEQGLNYRQIAARLGCAHSAVYRTLKTGKAAA
ncbi:helix-turn-helix domain-containing protein [Microvirga sp. GCM10011540]|uniref:helix-turn-helix domain-containing protein n=1 Tax=Microvirga sp. GCM10011540 TaxID=3317338 RepID=UPI00360BFFCC